MAEQTILLRSILLLVLFVAGTLVLGTLAGLVTASSIPTWYASLERPVFAPPNNVFGPVWTVLYLAIGVAGWLVWRAEESRLRQAALVLWFVQMGLNFLWSFLFFYFREIGFALVEIVLLLICIAANTATMWRVDRIAGWLFIPYLLWVGFATALNFGFWWLNT